MARPLRTDDLLAGAGSVHKVAIPGGAAFRRRRQRQGAIAGEVALRPLTLRDVQRVTQAAKEDRVLTSALMVQQALVEPEAERRAGRRPCRPGSPASCWTRSMPPVGSRISARRDSTTAVKAPLARACFALSKEFGWTPTECAELTIGQVLLYLEMIARGEHPEEGRA